MTQLQANELRKGRLVEIGGRICVVTHWNLWKSDRRSRVQMRFKDVLSGRVSEVTAQPDDRYTVFESEKIQLEHSYRDGADEVFYTPDGIEWRCPAAAVEDVLLWKADQYKGVVVDGRLLTLEPPPSAIATVVETAPSMKGITGGTKDAVLDNGLRVKVGVMVDVGDRVQIDTETLEYRGGV
jgi:translation elongation factor P/translation initiation factor 5A